MPDLLATLYKHDLGHLRIIASGCGLELAANEASAAAEELSECLLDAALIGELTESLAPEPRLALEQLCLKDGRIPWAEFSRQFGQIRSMGAAKRDRDQPHLQPASPAEILYYHALLDRAFFDSGKSPQEYAYIPDDLLAFVSESLGIEGSRPALVKAKSPIPETAGRPASPAEHGEEVPASDDLLEDATTVLAAFRLGIEPPATGIPRPMLEAFLNAAGLLQDSTPRPEPVKKFLEAPRHEALTLLSDAWLESETFNELHLLPGLKCEGEWTNQPLVTREFLLHLLEAIPDGQWWSLPAFIRAIKDKFPDFQRPAGDYDSWFIQRLADGTWLRGFSHWDQVDGALVHFFITNILHWLGMADLAYARDTNTFAAFRLSPPAARAEDKGRLSVTSDGMLTVFRPFPRAVRYQLSRFGEWQPEKPDAWRYRVTPASLRRAREQGLKVEHLLALLAKHTEAGIPPALVKALKTWETRGTEARLQSQVILRVARPEILEELRKSRAARFLGESLGPTSVVVKNGAQAKVLAALSEMGLLAEDETPGDNP